LHNDWKVFIEEYNYVTLTIRYYFP